MERKRKRRREGLGLPSDDDNIQPGFEIDLLYNISDGPSVTVYTGIFSSFRIYLRDGTKFAVKKLLQGLLTSLRCNIGPLKTSNIIF